MVKPASATSSSAAERPCVPIRDYALIGDCHGAALVAKDGGIDWWCAGRFDARPVLWRLLDAGKGPVFEIRPEGEAEAARAYLPDTNILRTVWTADGGTAAVTDFVPVGRAVDASAEDYVTLSAPGWLVRIVHGLQGRVRLNVRYCPASATFDGTAPADPPRDPTPETYALFTASGTPDGVPGADETIVMSAGETRAFVLAPVSAANAGPASEADRLLQVTRAFWEEWCGRCRYGGPYGEMVRRSALTLKLLTFAPTGAIVAAPTTSLPEEPGGIRNWDYRFSWLRDSAFVLQALAALGYSGEARRYCEFLRLCCVQKTLPALQVLYGIRGETALHERTLDHLEGYGGSRPVRVGNAACNQRQADIYGELADWALLYVALGEPMDATLRKILQGTADHVASSWRMPDQGIWEMRGEPRHHVHGKLMAWVALDRAIRLLGSRPGWETERDAILQMVMDSGLDAGHGYLTQAFDCREPDAALLLAPLLDLPVSRDLLAGTVDAVEARLREGDYVRRYLTPDGIPGGEGAFLICSFWLVDALLVLGRAEEALALFERLLAKSNDLGLYAEEVDPADGAFLGNFPQAFTHLALINSAVHLQLYERGGTAALAGTHADRSMRAAAARDAMREDTAGDGSQAGSRASILELRAPVPRRDGEAAAQHHRA